MYHEIPVLARACDRLGFWLLGGSVWWLLLASFANDLQSEGQYCRLALGFIAGGVAALAGGRCVEMAALILRGEMPRAARVPGTAVDVAPPADAAPATPHAHDDRRLAA